MTHSRMPASGYARIGSIAIAATLLVGLPACSSDPKAVVEATVVQVIDGGTVEVSQEGGSKQTVVLAGIETEQDDPDGAKSCLTGESADFVKRELPPGAPVQIRLASGVADSELTATGTVLLGDGLSLNEALVREGLAIPTTASTQDGGGAELLSAQDAARSAQAGLYSGAISCTVPGQVAAFTGGVNCAAVQAQVQESTTASTSSSSAPATASPRSTATTSTEFSATVTASGSAEIAAQVEAAALLIKQATGLRQAIVLDPNTISWRALNEVQQASCNKIINDVVVFASRDHDSLVAALLVAQLQEAEAARVAEEQRAAAEAEAARVAEEQRLAAETEAARVAEEQRLAAEAEASRVAAEQQAAADAEAARVAAQEAEAQRRSAAAARQTASNSPGGSTGSPGSPSTYTGPRCYAPGGRTWTPC